MNNANTGGPQLLLVSDQSEHDIAIRGATDDLTCSLREVLANLLRIQRGAGKPEDLGDMVVRCAMAFDAYADAAGGRPPRALLDAAINLERCDQDYRPSTRIVSESDRARWERDGSAELDRAKQQAIRGAMQIMASRLLGQGTQRQQGDDEFRRGVVRWQEQRERNRTSMLRYGSSDDGIEDLSALI